jgi:hypothetical protein
LTEMLCLCLLLEISTLIFGEEGAGTSVIMIQLGKLHFCPKVHQGDLYCT